MFSHSQGITTNDIVSHLVTKDREKEQDLSPDSTVTRATAEQNDPKHQATDKPANEGNLLIIIIQMTLDHEFNRYTSR